MKTSIDETNEMITNLEHDLLFYDTKNINMDDINNKERESLYEMCNEVDIATNSIYRDLKEIVDEMNNNELSEINENITVKKIY